jgi:hypothetical protein
MISFMVQLALKGKGVVEAVSEIAAMAEGVGSQKTERTWQMRP